MKFTKTNVIIICVVALAAAVIAGFLIFADNDGQDGLNLAQPLPQDWPAAAPDPRKQTPQKTMEFVKSEEFAQLAPEHQQYYMRSTSNKVMQYQVEKFSSLPAEEKEAFLDEVIDNFEQWQQQSQLNQDIMPISPGASQVRTPGEPLTLEQRAQFAEFRQALRQRMLQRGIEPGRPKY